MGSGGHRWRAGRPGYRGKAEELFRVDVRWMSRQGYLSGWGGTLTYSVGGERVGRIGYRIEGGALVLDYTLHGEPRQQRVPILRTHCHYGGTRPWLACPHCARRCAVLYLRRGGFYCRQCAQVAYSSQSEDFVGRTWRVQQNAEAKLGEDWSRPRGMHHKTYDRLLATILRCEEVRDVALVAFIERHAHWVDDR